MTSSEKYCLKVDEFESSFIDSLKELRASADLFDVTLVSDYETPVQAHKLVLSASSLFFKNIFKFNKNNHPILYIRGLSEIDLKNVLEFLYNGEVQVAHEELEKFLEVAKDLKLKGMYEPENLHQPKKVHDDKKESGTKIEEKETNSKKALVEIEEQTDMRAEDFNFDNLLSTAVENDIVPEDLLKTGTKIVATDIDNLDAKIEDMMFRENGLWHCKMCSKSKVRKTNISSHIETNHLENSIPCNFCEVISRNRPALAKHVRAKHTAA